MVDTKEMVVKVAKSDAAVGADVAVANSNTASVTNGDPAGVANKDADDAAVLDEP